MLFFPLSLILPFYFPKELRANVPLGPLTAPSASMRFRSEGTSGLQSKPVETRTDGGIGFCCLKSVKKGRVWVPRVFLYLFMLTISFESWASQTEALRQGRVVFRQAHRSAVLAQGSMHDWKKNKHCFHTAKPKVHIKNMSKSLCHCFV